MPQCALARECDGQSDSFPEAAAATFAVTPLEVLRFIMEAEQRNQRVALVTIVNLTGSSSRSVGTLMGVAEDGSFAGSFSGGCIEAAVVAEAQEAMRDGFPRQVLYGSGSPYIDIRLPCGGGVTLLIQPNPGLHVIRQAVSCFEERQPLTLAQNASGDLHIVPGPTQQQPGWRGETFISWYAPPLRLVVVGHGLECLALVRLGLTYGTELKLLSPDERLVRLARVLGSCANLLDTPTSPPNLVADPWSAVVFLFHDHAWEPLFLEQALSQPWFFVGAMGSRRTHTSRLATLRARGLPELELGRIIAPLGLIPSARDPVTLALSVLSQVVDEYLRVASTSAGSARDGTSH